MGDEVVALLTNRCAANRPSTTSENGFVNLFQNADDLASQATSTWWGGFAMSSFFVVLASFLLLAEELGQYVFLSL